MAEKIALCRVHIHARKSDAGGLLRPVDSPGSTLSNTVPEISCLRNKNSSSFAFTLQKNTGASIVWVTHRVLQVCEPLRVESARPAIVGNLDSLLPIMRVQ